MPARDKEIRPPERDADLFTAPDGTQRLLELMARWSEGWSLTQMASAWGISRQRVRAILRRVGCTQSVRSIQHPARHSVPSRRPPPARVGMTLRLLAHPRARRLTIRQLAAVAWTAQGLMPREIATRMGVTPQYVLRLLVAARQRLERQARQQPPRQRRTGPAAALPPIELPPLCWEGLTQSVSAHSLDVEHHFEKQEQ